jgi:putative Holliday junction resolvase
VTGAARAGTALGFDFGTRRIGVAIGNLLTRSAAPLTTVCGGGPDWAAIGALIEEWKPDALVVGVPYNADGSESALTASARRFARQLTGRFGLPVHEVDERWTSMEAAAVLRQQRRSGLRRRPLARGDVDSQAARLVLQDWLESRSHDDRE